MWILLVKVVNEIKYRDRTIVDLPITHFKFALYVAAILHFRITSLITSSGKKEKVK